VNWIRLTLIKYIDRFRTALLRDVLAMQSLAPLTEGYIPWNAASMRPSSVIVILNEIMFNHRQSILECGSGISTIYIAALLRNTGGHLFTVENDPGWINTIRAILLRNRLESCVTIIEAPLTETSLSWDGSLWYAEETIRASINGIKLDLLIVDGPPAGEKGHRLARYPAVPFATPYLAEDYSIILHDIHRPGEQHILKKWGKNLNISFEYRYRDGFIGVGRTKHRLDV
jgi:hypothetical protein